jgi:PKD repeat protein
MVQKAFNDNPQLQVDFESFNQWIAENEPEFTSGAEANYIIPVVVHIIHDNGMEYISDAQIADAIRILNEDFNKLNSDANQVVASFNSRVGNAGFEFRLAKKDPNGNCSNGITRTQSYLTYNADDKAKSLVYWPRNKYYNIWVVNSIESSGGGIIGGYAYLPGTAPTAATDGIILDNRYTGSIGTADGSNFNARVITQETGHFFGLLHPCGFNACGSGCGDDLVTDVPATSGSCNNCNLSQTTCGSLDNVENFMDYALCSKMFTTGQASRMNTAINASSGQRNSLWQSANLIATGTQTGFNQNCAPIADFYADKTTACTGSALLLTDRTTNATPTSWSWSISNGTQTLTSTDQNPYITFNSPGDYSVTLTVGSAGGTNSVTRQKAIRIVDANADDQNWVYFDTFNNNPLNFGRWTATSTPNSPFGWESSSQVFYTWPNSLKVNNNGSPLGKRYTLISPSYDFSAMNGNLRMSFRFAYAKRATSSDDRLLISISSNCGQTWTLRRTMTANELASSGITTADFIPSTKSDWRTDSLTGTTLQPWANRTNVRLKFDFISGGGNHFYLDDINISGPLSIENQIIGLESLQVFPNPARQSFSVHLNLAEAGLGLFQLTDLSGRIVHEWSSKLGMGEQAQTLNVPNHIQSGTYMLSFKKNSIIQIQRLILQ